MIAEDGGESLLSAATIKIFTRYTKIEENFFSGKIFHDILWSWFHVAPPSAIILDYK